MMALSEIKIIYLIHVHVQIYNYRVDNVRHTSGYFFIANFIMTKIFQPSDKIKLIFILFNNEPV